MACVHAYAYAFLVFDMRYYFGKMFEPESQVGTLSGGRFYNRRYSGGFLKGDVYRVGDKPETFIFRHLVHVRSGMEVEHRKSELLASFHLVKEGFARQVQLLCIGRPEVYQEAVVWKYHRRSETEALAVLAEYIGVLSGDGRNFPTRGVACEQRECRHTHL